MSNSEIIFLVEESLEGGYEAKALGEPIFTQAESHYELEAMIHDAVRNHFDDYGRPHTTRLYPVH